MNGSKLKSHAESYGSRVSSRSREALAIPTFSE